MPFIRDVANALMGKVSGEHEHSSFERAWLCLQDSAGLNWVYDLFIRPFGGTEDLLIQNKSIVHPLSNWMMIVSFYVLFFPHELDKYGRMLVGFLITAVLCVWAVVWLYAKTWEPFIHSEFAEKFQGTGMILFAALTLAAAFMIVGFDWRRFPLLCKLIHFFKVLFNCILKAFMELFGVDPNAESSGFAGFVAMLSGYFCSFFSPLIFLVRTIFTFPIQLLCFCLSYFCYMLNCAPKPEFPQLPWGDGGQSMCISAPPCLNEPSDYPDCPCEPATPMSRRQTPLVPKCYKKPGRACCPIAEEEPVRTPSCRTRKCPTRRTGGRSSCRSSSIGSGRGRRSREACGEPYDHGY